MGFIKRALDRAGSAIKQSKQDLKLHAVEAYERKKKEKAIFKKAFQDEKEVLLAKEGKEKARRLVNRGKEAAQVRFGGKKSALNTPQFRSGIPKFKR